MSTQSSLVSSWSPLLLIGFLLKKSFCLALNCLLNLAASCLDDENEIPLKVIVSFSAVRFALSSIHLIVLRSLVRSVFWSMFSTKSLHFCRYAHRCVSGCLYSVLAVWTKWGLFCRGRLWSSRPVGMWCDAVLSRIVRRILLAVCWKERLLRAASTSCVPVGLL